MTKMVLGEEFLVNTTTIGGQGASSIAALSNGRLVIGFQNNSLALDEADYNGISAQIFTSKGFQFGTEHLLNTQEVEVQTQLEVAPLTGGGFVATWTTFDPAQDGDFSAIKARVFDSSGKGQGPEFLVNQFSQSAQLYPHVTGLANGNFVIVWADNILPGTHRARIYKPDGAAVGDEFVITSQSQPRFGNDVKALPDGGFLATWYQITDAVGDTSTVQRFGADGGKIGGEILVNTQTDGDQGPAKLAVFSDGGFVAVWVSTLNGAQTIKAQLFDADGKKSGSEFMVNLPDNTYNDTPDLAVLNDGTFVTTWVRPSWHYTPQGNFVNDGNAVALQMFDRSGAPIGEQLLIDSDNAGDPYVTATREGGYAITWSDLSKTLGDTDGSAVKARIFGPNSTPVITSGKGVSAVYGVAERTTEVVKVLASDLDINAKLTFSITGGRDAGYFQIDPATGALRFTDPREFNADSVGANMFLFTVQVSDGHDSDTQDIRVRVLDVVEPKPTEGSDRLIGAASNDVIGGLGGNDVMFGRGGNDTLYGDDGNDILDGGTGSDAMVGGLGNDTFVVDDQQDWVVEDAGGGMDTVKSSIAYGLGSATERLLLTGTADLIGTGNEVGNTLVGNSGNNTLDGFAGNDRLVGGAGNDTLSGGSGIDVLTGNAGADVFAFKQLLTTSDRDLIHDFAHGSDKIAISRAGFAAFADHAAGALLTSELALGPRATTPEQHLVYNQANGVLYYDADGSGGEAKVVLAVFKGQPMLDASDFLIA